eukprot:m.57528 g.57528  ORF g.57528 m.57528 type:complete len:96 (-) comp9358_c0_seq1:953-1240(-)
MGCFIHEALALRDSKKNCAAHRKRGIKNKIERKQTREAREKQKVLPWLSGKRTAVADATARGRTAAGPADTGGQHRRGRDTAAKCSVKDRSDGGC